MSVSAVSTAALPQTQGAQAPGDSQVSKLMQLEQNVRNTELSFRKKARQKGLSEEEIENKIKKYNKLISEIEQQIREAKQQRVRRKEAAAERRTESAGETRRASGAASDYSGLFVTALETSYLMLPIPSLDAETTLSVLQPPRAEEETVTPQKLDATA